MLLGATWSAISLVKVLWRRLLGCLFGFSPRPVLPFTLEKSNQAMVHSSYGFAENVRARNGMNKLISDVEGQLFASCVGEDTTLAQEATVCFCATSKKKTHLRLATQEMCRSRELSSCVVIRMASLWVPWNSQKT